MAGEKRSQNQDEILHATAIIVDIEGTTTSISFVKDTLFPYVRQNLKTYIETKWEDEEFKQDYEKLKEQAKKDTEDKLDGFVAITGDKPEEQKESLLKNVLWQMDNDRKTGALKQLQGHMWREAYNTGAVKAHVYDDVPKALEAWTKDAKKIYVYSSGSVEAQKLLFGHSTHGDLLKYFSGHFDTEVGGKQESNSYKNILNKIGEQPSNVVFLTDVVKEAAAAKEAGLSAVVVAREGNAALTDEDKVKYTIIKSFLDLSFQSSSKRAKIDTADKKTDEATVDGVEPMDTSEDVEMSDVTDKKAGKTKEKDTTESEKTECLKSRPSENASTSLTKEESAAVEKDPSNTKQENPIAETKETDVKSKDTDGEVSASENAEKMIENNTTTKDDKVTEKTEENLNAATTEIPSTTDDTMDVSLSLSTSKSESTPVSSEKKTEDSTDVVKDTKNEIIDKIQTTESSENNEKTDGATETKAQTSDTTVTDKPEECLAAEKEKAKEEAKVASDASETVNVAKSEQEEITKMDTDVTENGKPAETADEKKPTVSPKEMEATTSATESKKESTTPVETSVEKTSEAVAKSEKVEEKTPQAMETEVAINVEKSENEAAKQETAKEGETVKEENVMDKKDTNTVDSEKQKLNGTAHSGDTDVPVLDDKLHSNGLNEGQSKEATSEDTAAQNGDPESSSETSAETIKVKKVVDSAVDGAGEPDVVPPVVVAATS